MTIPKITPYSGGVANPDGSQTQTEFTQNMFDQLSYEAELSTELNNTVDGINDTATQVDSDATSAAQSANNAEAAASGLNYQGLWPDTGGSADKGDTYQTQVSGTPTGQYFTALQNTTVDPIGDDVNWREVVTTEYVTTAQGDIVGGSIFKGSNGEHVQNGDVVPVGTTHLRVLVSGKTTIVAMSPVASGAVSLLTESGATVGSMSVYFYSVSDDQLATLSKYNSITEALNTKYSVYIDKSTSTSSITPKVNSRFVGDNGSLLSVPVGQTAFTGNSTEDDFKYAEISGIRAKGNGKVEDGTKFISFNGDANKAFNVFSRLRLEGFDTCIERSAGWCNTSLGVDCRGSVYGLKYVDSPIVGGWASSGDVSINSSYQYNTYGIYDEGAPWLNTYINSVIEGNNLGFRHNGANTVMINPWFEGNTKNLEIERGLVVLGGRSVAWDSVDSSIYLSEEAITTIDRGGIYICHDGSNKAGADPRPLFKATGYGVEWIQTRFAGVNSQDTRSMMSGSVVTDGGVTGEFYKAFGLKANGARYESRITDVYDKDNDASDVSGIDLGVVKNSVDTVEGRVSIRTGRYITPGHESNDRSTGIDVNYTSVTPKITAFTDVGSASLAFKDGYFQNAITVVSDERVKYDIVSISDELCDFALTIEHKLYKLNQGSSGRKHVGVIVNQAMIDAINAISNTDDLAFLVHNTFTRIVEDDNGTERAEAYTIDFGHVQLGDIWQVRYEELHGLMIEAMRRKLNKL